MADDTGTRAGKGTYSIDDFLDESGAGASSLRTYRKLLTRCESLLGRPLAEASPRALSDLKARLREKRSGPNYVRRLKAFYRAAGRDDLAKLCVLKQRVRRLMEDDILSLDDVDRLVRAADSIRDRALLTTLWTTGQRVGAVCALTLGDLRDVPSDNGGRAIRLAFRKVKVKGEEHTSYILDREGGDHLRAWVDAYPFDRTPGSPLFPSYNFAGDVGGKALTESGALKIVQSTARRAKIGKRVYCHLFRHSRATYLLRMGMDSVSVKKLCGWSPGSPVMERTYAHLATSDAYRALLRANGLAVPDLPDLGKLSAYADLPPVVAMREPPGRGKAGVEPHAALTAAASSGELDRLLRDPNVVRVLQLLQEAKGA